MWLQVWVHILCLFVCAWDVFNFGIMSCHFVAPLRSTTTFPLFMPHISLFISTLHLQFYLCHLCYCHSCESFLRRIMGTHICSWCNLVCVLSAKYLEEKLIIMVGSGDQREMHIERVSVLKLNFEHMTSPSSSSSCSPQHIAHTLQSHVRTGCNPLERD